MMLCNIRGKYEFCDQCTPELFRDRFIVGIHDETLITKPQNGSQRPFIYFYKRQAAAILDNRKSRLITFLDISDNYATFIFFHKMAAGAHFG